MDYNYDFNLPKKKKTFLTLSQKENIHTSETLSNILLKVHQFRFENLPMFCSCKNNTLKILSS